MTDAGDVVAAWVSSGGVATARRSSTGAWRTSLVAESRGASAVDLALPESGNAVVAWTRADGAVEASLRPAGLGDWLPATVVSSRRSSRPAVEVDATQRAVATWNRTDGARIVVESADLAGRGPVLVGLVVPRRALVVGSRGGFSVRPAPWAAPLVGQPRWRFGDRARGSGARVAHAYARAGRYTVTVTQADTTGLVSTLRGAVRVIAARLRNRKRPWIQGTPRVGAMLTCRRGRWTGSPPVRFTYEWRRDGRIVSGATSRQRRLREGDAGSLIACAVRATNPAGSVRAVSGPVSVR
jgi:hypothetical protein